MHYSDSLCLSLYCSSHRRYSNFSLFHTLILYVRHVSLLASRNSRIVSSPGVSLLLIVIASLSLHLLDFLQIFQISNFFFMNFDFSIPNASAATTLADISSNYSAGNMITTGVAIVVLVAIICAVLFIVW